MGSDKTDCANYPAMDAYSPIEMACKAESIGVKKANMDFISTLMLSILAGAFIAFGSCFYTTVTTSSNLGLGVTRLLGATCFSLGLILVVVAGAELFTGNTLIVIAAISRKIRIKRLLWNWLVVYFGNLIGSLIVVALVFYSGQWKMGNGAVGVNAYNIAGSKLDTTFAEAFCSGILCNALVCLAVWLCYSARSTTDKILSIIFPIAAFVTLGFEHSVANMYIIPYGIMIAHKTAIAASFMDLKYEPSLFTISGCILKNLIPVTLGNIVGGSMLIGLVYWVIYLRPGGKTSGKPAERVEEHSGDERIGIR